MTPQYAPAKKLPQNFLQSVIRENSRLDECKTHENSVLFVNAECLLGVFVYNVAYAYGGQHLDKVRQETPVETSNAFFSMNVSK